MSGEDGASAPGVSTIELSPGRAKAQRRDRNDQIRLVKPIVAVAGAAYSDERC
jgi:hypothetical protein